MERIDRRVRRTRRAIQDALTELIEEKGYAAVTVTDVVRRADVGRSTFYTHFTGTRDVLFTSIAEVAEAAGRAGRNRPFAFSEPLLEHIDEHRHLPRALLGPDGDAHVRDRVRSTVAALVRADLLTRDVPPARLDGAVADATRVFMTLLTRWTHHGTAETPARLDAIFRGKTTSTTFPDSTPPTVQ